jgi:hypothetical protein
VLVLIIISSLFLPPNLAAVVKKDYRITAFSVTEFFGYSSWKKRRRRRKEITEWEERAEI